MGNYLWKVSQCLKWLLSLFVLDKQDSSVVEIKRGAGPSPFPELDKYMLEVFKRSKQEAEIRLWILLYTKFRNIRLMQYQVGYLIN